MVVRICPKCKSKDIHSESMKGMNVIAGVPPIFTCNHCGFSGSIFPEVDEDY